MLVSFDLYAELLADQQEQRERRHWLLNTSWVAVEQQRQEEQSLKQQARTITPSVVALGDSLDTSWLCGRGGAETLLDTVDEEAAAHRHVTQLIHQDTVFAIARQRGITGDAAAARINLHTGAADGSVQVHPGGEATSSAPGLRRGSAASLKTVRPHSSNIEEERPQGPPSLQERAGGGTTNVTGYKAPSDIEDATRQSIAVHAPSLRDTEEQNLCTSLIEDSQSAAASQKRSQQQTTQLVAAGQLVREHAHTEQPRHRQHHVCQEPSEGQDSCPYWCVPTEGCYTTYPVYATCARVRVPGNPQQQQSQQQRAAPQQPNQPVSLLEEAEGFVAQAAVSAAAAELLRVQQEHMQQQGIQQPLVQQGPNVQLKKTSSPGACEDTAKFLKEIPGTAKASASCVEEENAIPAESGRTDSLADWRRIVAEETSYRFYRQQTKKTPRQHTGVGVTEHKNVSSGRQGLMLLLLYRRGRGPFGSSLMTSDTTYRTKGGCIIDSFARQG